MSDNPYERPDLYLADCMEAMAHFPDDFFDLAVVDPPYGISVTDRHKCGNAVKIVGGWPPLSRGTATYRHDRPMQISAVGIETLSCLRR